MKDWMDDWAGWITRLIRSFERVGDRPALRADDDTVVPWIRVRVTYRAFACARCKVAIKDGEEVWSRGLEIIHDACQAKDSASIVHCWRCGKPNRLKAGIAGARCGRCRAKLAKTVN